LRFLHDSGIRTEGRMPCGTRLAVVHTSRLFGGRDCHPTGLRTTEEGLISPAARKPQRLVRLLPGHAHHLLPGRAFRELNRPDRISRYRSFTGFAVRHCIPSLARWRNVKLPQGPSRETGAAFRARRHRKRCCVRYIMSALVERQPVKARHLTKHHRHQQPHLGR
jgi:hypothetical protein